MLLGGACSAPAAVTACPAANQHHHIPCLGTFSYHILFWGSTHNRANFHALGHIVGVINFTYLARSKADLIAVGAVAVGSRAGYHPLRKLSRKGFGKRRAGIAASCHTHSLIDIGASRKRITNSSAQTCGCTAKGFNFCGMVMGLIFKHNEPVLIPLILFCFNHNAARINFLGFIQIIKISCFPKMLHGQGCHIHKGDIFLFVTVNRFAGIKIKLINLFNPLPHRIVLKRNVLKLR